MIAPSCSRFMIGTMSISGSLRHDHAGGVHAPVADLALEPERGLVDLADVGVRVVQRAELAALAVALVRRGRRCP